MPLNLQRISGKNGYIRVVADDEANVRVKVPFFMWTATMETVFQDATGSCNYNKGDGIVYKSSAPVLRSLTAEIRGRYRRDSTPANVIAQLYNGDKPFRVELGFNPLDPFVDFYAWVENFEASNPILDVVSYSCSLRSEGTISDLANLTSGLLGPEPDPGD